MADMNANLIVAAGQQPNLMNALAQGTQAAQMTNEVTRQNALAGLYRDQGAQILAGDQSALNKLAQFDPNAALGVQDARLRQDATRAGMANDSAQLGMQRQQLELAQAQGARAAEAHAAQMDATTLANQVALVDRAIGAAQGAQTPEQWDQIMDSLGPQFAQYKGQFAQKDALIGMARGYVGGLKGAEYGLNPIFGRDAEGNVVVLQTGKDGTATQTRLPEGVSVDLSVKSRESARGKAEGEAAQQLPGAYAEAEHVIGMVDDLIGDDYLKEMVGPINSRKPNVSADAARVQSRMDQVAGQGFMAARQFLKGQGQITDFESRRAEAAIARLNAAQSYDDYVDALREFQDAVRVGILKAERAAGQFGVPAQSQPGGPITIDGYSIQQVE